MLLQTYNTTSVPAAVKFKTTTTNPSFQIKKDNWVRKAVWSDVGETGLYSVDGVSFLLFNTVKIHTDR